MRFLRILFLLILLTSKLNAQSSEEYLRSAIKNVIGSIDPDNKLNGLISIYYKGELINADTSKIEIFKLFPDSFKSHVYKESDSLTSIVSKNGYYQYRNGDKLKTEKSEFDQDIYYDLVKFNLYFALNNTYKNAEIELLEETKSFIIFKYEFKAGQLYTFKLNKENMRIVEYSCDCLKVNYHSGYVRLKNY
ncbi:hypothetical protein SAMN05661096_01478 [Marivirga sericea]|uniref:Outer membrane lipoprotein-sorting protein n=2 Tax=Marivirga sericea TaxID=1028 RepID=A0A1X7JBD5_9BACT|nr:hypothetical protein SAMN05661096_01478 [Marivirga sericea]